MIYFDNAATTYPKPLSVIKAVETALYDYGANPGRSGHRLSEKTSQAVFEARENCADFFGAETGNLSFTLNCTASLNYAIKGVAYALGRCKIITTDLEHNSVIRPIYSLSRDMSFEYSVAESFESDDDFVNSIKSHIDKNTKIIVMTAGCNVDGRITPIKRIAELCRKHHICLIADMAQAAGVLELTLKDGINIICAPGHKGLYGPMGTGILATDGKFPIKPLIEGGTGSMSLDIRQPDFMPDLLESGTINTPSVIALNEAVNFVRSKGVNRIRNHENMLCDLFIKSLSANSRVRVLRKDGISYLPVVSFTIDGVSSSDAARIFSDNGFYLRSGFHCNFLANKKLGTDKDGTIRFAPSVFNSREDVYRFCRFINKRFN